MTRCEEASELINNFPNWSPREVLHHWCTHQWNIFTLSSLQPPHWCRDTAHHHTEGQDYHRLLSDTDTTPLCHHHYGYTLTRSTRHWSLHRPSHYGPAGNKKGPEIKHFSLIAFLWNVLLFRLMLAVMCWSRNHTLELYRVQGKINFPSNRCKNIAASHHPRHPQKMYT